MDRELWQLLWKELQTIECDLRWSSLERFAEAVAAEPGWIDELFAAYEWARETAPERASCVHLYVPAILALAAQDLGPAHRLKAGRFLLDQFLEAGEEDDHLLMEVLGAACGSMGQVILPLVLEAVGREVEPSGAWGRLWGFTRLAVDLEDEATRSAVAEACVELLERVGREEVEFELGIEAAWTLALMQCDEHRDPLCRLEYASQWTLTHADYRAARECFDRRCNDSPDPELWQLPVKEWFEPRWQKIRDWLLVRDSGRGWEVLHASNTPRPAGVPIGILEHSPRTGRKSVQPCGTPAST